MKSGRDRAHIHSPARVQSRCSWLLVTLLPSFCSCNEMRSEEQSRLGKIVVDLGLGLQLINFSLCFCLEVCGPARGWRCSPSSFQEESVTVSLIFTRITWENFVPHCLQSDDLELQIAVPIPCWGLTHIH